MSGLTIIQSNPHPHGIDGPHHHIDLWVDRATLAKRRWRGTAVDGREFGFDLTEPINHGAHFFADGANYYVIEQRPEDIIEIAVSSPREAGSLGWKLGNLHLPVEAGPEYLRAPNDPAVIQLLEREHIPFRKLSAVFLPLRAESSHHHHHD